jgi:hypothetical protein
MKRTAQEEPRVTPPLRSRLTIAFVGSLGVGKSGLINALLLGKRPELKPGQETASDPSYPLPSRFDAFSVTNHFVRVSYEESDRFTLRENGVCSSVDALNKVARLLDSLEKSPGPGVLDLTGPFPCLPPGVTLIDCPGWGHPKVTRTLYSILSEADAIVHVAPRLETMRQALFLGLGAHSSLASRKLPLFVSACFMSLPKEGEEQSDARKAMEDVHALPFSPLVKTVAFNRYGTDLTVLIDVVSDHVCKEWNRLLQFEAQCAADATENEECCKMRASLDSPEAIAKIRAQFLEDMFTLHGGVRQPLVDHLEDVSLNALCGYNDEGGLLLHLAFAFENQFRTILQRAVTAMVVSQDDEIKLDPAKFQHWAQRATLRASIPLAIPGWEKMQEDDVSVEERYQAANTALAKYRQAMRDEGINMLLSFETDVLKMYFRKMKNAQ